LWDFVCGEVIVDILKNRRAEIYLSVWKMSLYKHVTKILSSIGSRLNYTVLQKFMDMIHEDAIDWMSAV
jgi:hypothetical protein